MADATMGKTLIAPSAPQQVAGIVVKAPPAELEREPMVANQRSIAWISDAIAGVAEGKTPKWWWQAFVPSVIMMTVCFSMVIYLVSVGVGVWGPGHPVMWGWAIVNFV